MSDAISAAKPDLAKPDFRAIASDLIHRGFRVTPVSPETKMGCMRNWQNFQLHSEMQTAELEYHLNYWSGYNVGVVGKRGVGRHCFLDIDADGVLERIEKESGHQMPKTYTVCSRPQSAPYKRHFYFVQTEYSFKQFGGWDSLNANVKDLTRFETSKKGNLIHPTLYDVKGIGGGSLVVGAGSVRDTGEVYTCIDDSPVCPIPNWLVDWLVTDIQKYKSAKTKEYEQKQKKSVSHDFDGFDIAEEDIYDFLRWRASQLSGLGLSGEILAAALRHLVKTQCQGGEAFVAKSEHTITEIVEERHVGNATWFYRRTPDTKAKGLVITRGITKQEMLREVFANFPDIITRTEALETITEGLMHEGFRFDERQDKDALVIARRQTGFKAAGHFWERLKN